MLTSSACLDTPINGLYERLWLLRNVPLHWRVLEPVHRCTIHTWDGRELRVILVVQELRCWMESWCITIQRIHTPTPQRVEFSRFPAPQCTRESSFHWAIPCKVHCHRNSSGECRRRGVGACPFHCCHCRWWECLIRCRGNADELEQHSTWGSSRSPMVQVLTLDHNKRRVRESVAKPNSTIAHTKLGSVNSRHTISNAHCNSSRRRIRCHSIRKWSSG